MSELKSALDPRDLRILDATAERSWLPKDPRELLLPYGSKETAEEEESEIDLRRRKAKEVYDGYGDIIKKAKVLKDEIAEKCKDVKISLQPKTQSQTIAAVKRAFRTDGTKITFAMYKAAVEKLAEISNNAMPKINIKEQ